MTYIVMATVERLIFFSGSTTNVCHQLFTQVSLTADAMPMKTITVWAITIEVMTTGALAGDAMPVNAITVWAITM